MTTWDAISEFSENPGVESVRIVEETFRKGGENYKWFKVVLALHGHSKKQSFQAATFEQAVQLCREAALKGETP